MTSAGKILQTPDRTPKERRDMAEFWAGGGQWLGKDMYVWTFRDGSKLAMVYDESLCPLEMVEV